MTRQIHLHNRSAFPFTGWVRRPIDWTPDGTSGLLGGVPWVRGKQCGKDLHYLDVRVALAPNEKRTLDFDAPSTPRTPPLWVPPPFLPKIAGVQMTLVSSVANGAGLDLHYFARVGPMLAVHLWTTIYASQPWQSAEMQVVACNPDVPDLQGTVPAGFDLTLDGTTAVQRIHGTNNITNGAQLIPVGTKIGHGQGWPVIRLLFRWPPGSDATAVESGKAFHQVSARGAKAWPAGDPLTIPEGDLAAVHATLAGWAASPLGIYADAHRTGGEADNTFVGGSGSDLLAWAIAAGYVRRPLHYLEADGKPLDLDGHPNLCLYDGKPHAANNSEMLGKPRNVNAVECNGWDNWGEHYFANWLIAAYRLTGSKALQFQIECHARNWLFQHFSDRPQFSTNMRLGSQREQAWDCLMAYHLWQNLADGVVAQRVKERWLAYFAPTFRQRYQGKRYWDVTNDTRLSQFSGKTPNWFVYQNAMQSYFVWLCAREFGAADIEALCHDEAKAVIEDAFQQDGMGKWRGWLWVGVRADGTLWPLVQGNGGHHNAVGGGSETWMTPALAVVLHYEPTHARARAIADQWIAEKNEQGRWIPPELLVASQAPPPPPPPPPDPDPVPPPVPAPQQPIVIDVTLPPGSAIRFRQPDIEVTVDDGLVVWSPRTIPPVGPPPDTDG